MYDDGFKMLTTVLCVMVTLALAGHADDYFQRLVEHPELAPQRIASVISRDIPRTFGGIDLRHYSRAEAERKLERVLLAYASRNQVLGYCQSMNFLVAFFLV